jgi:hypothetical protein
MFVELGDRLARRRIDRRQRHGTRLTVVAVEQAAQRTEDAAFADPPTAGPW